MEKNKLYMDKIKFDFPKHPLDEDKYPTKEALDYIKNWSMIVHEDKVETGQFFGSANYDHLIDYIKSIWWMGDDCIEYKDGLLELHTLGWSGNESIIDELKETSLWLTKFRAQQSGGHYYFLIERKGWDWEVTKTISKW